MNDFAIDHPGGLDRRDFLRRGAIAAAMWYAEPLRFLPGRQSRGGETAPREPLRRRGAPKRVVIVGAGLAGLVAAYELREAGHDVLLLEAQTHPGGRVRTLREPFSDGLHAEAGAGRIPRAHALTLGYAERFGLELDPFYPSTRADVTLVRGRRLELPAGTPPDLVRLPLDLTAEERRLGIGGMVEKYLGPMLRDLGDPLTPGWPPPSLAKYDRVTFVDYLLAQGASRDAVFVLLLGLGNPSETGWPSALWVGREFLLGWATSGMRAIRGGMDRLPRAFASRLSSVIRYGAPVTRIERHPGCASVIVQRAGETERVEGDVVLCAIPFSVLRRIEVVPAFSPSKQRAIRELNYWPITRVYLQFRRRTWLGSGCSGFATTDWSEEVWSPTWNQQGVRGILVSYIKGTRARALASMPEDERIRVLLDHVEDIHPGITADFEAGASTSWDDDPFARGGVAAMTPGQLTTIGPHIGTPEGTVYFAGEHASPWQGWMQGALWSGLDAARAINASH